MKKPGVFAMLMKFLGIVILIDLILIGLVLLMGWWAGWQTEEEFKSAIQIAGILVVGIGFMGIKGNWDVTRSFEYQYSMSTTQKSSWERTQQNLTDFAQSYTFMIIMFLAGGLCLVIGWLP
jgi:uncharacterized membrane protein